MYIYVILKYVIIYISHTRGRALKITLYVVCMLLYIFVPICFIRRRREKYRCCLATKSKLFHIIYIGPFHTSMIELMEILLCNVFTEIKIVAMITASHFLLFTVIFR